MTDLIDKTETLSRRRAAASARRAPWIDESRALLTLAAPLVLTQLAQMAIGTTDLILLGRYSQTALASAAIGSTVYWFAWLHGRRSGLGGLADDRPHPAASAPATAAASARHCAWACGRWASSPCR